MQITNIQKGKGSSYHIFVDENYYASYPRDLLAELGLRVGMQCSQSQLMEWKQKADYRRAKERALYLLEYRDHSRKELVDKLGKNVSAEIAEEIADRMQELGFLDDWAYAKKLARSLMIGKKRGVRRVIYEMQQKGIGSEMAQRAIDEIEVDPTRQLEELLQRKYASKLDGSWQAKQKVTAALTRMGYDYQDIRTALNRFENGME